MRLTGVGVLLGIAVLQSAGCAVSDTDPFELFVPESYRREHYRPLLVLCHDGGLDGPKQQVRDWATLAEQKGFLLAAPHLCGTKSFPKPKPDKQVALQMEDERRILNTVRHLKGAYSISEDRVFLVGWAGGSYAVLHTGLRHPEVFRALAVQQVEFDPFFVAEAAEGIDPHQPVAVVYGSTDSLVGKSPQPCIEWLVEKGAAVQEYDVSRSHRGDPQRVVEFLEQVLLNLPWLRIRSLGVDGEDPLTVQFKTQSSFEPQTFHWTFGDGADSPVAEPIHRFAAPGKYVVTMIVRDRQRKRFIRSITLTVPQVHAMSAERTEWDDTSSR